MPNIVTAAMLVIGDEILSGRTRDRNVGFVAEYLTGLGIDLKEVRIVADDEPAIIEAVNALRERYTYVFTTGGIGPTHDDITADAISAAFGLPCTHHPVAMKEMAASYAKRGLEFTPARQRMARTPKGASLIENAVSKAPGFRIGNVHVMAGVPAVMQAMMDALAPTLEGGRKMLSTTIDCPFGEGDIGGPLKDIQEAHRETMIGSYPRFDNGRYSTQIVIRGREQEQVDAAALDVASMVAGLANT